MDWNQRVAVHIAIRQWVSVVQGKHWSRFECNTIANRLMLTPDNAYASYALIQNTGVLRKMVGIKTAGTKEV